MKRVAYICSIDGDACGIVSPGQGHNMHPSCGAHSGYPYDFKRGAGHEQPFWQTSDSKHLSP